MNRFLIPAILWAAALPLTAQDLQKETPPQEVPQEASVPESRFDHRASLAVIDDATFYGNLRVPVPATLNQLLLEPTLSLRERNRWTLSTSLIGQAQTYTHTVTRLRVKEAYGVLSAGDFDLTAGRRMVRWGTGYAFSAAGVLDPLRDPTNPTDRLNLNQGRDMLKADWVHGQHALALAWSTAVLAPAGSNMRATTAFRYNVLVHGFDTSMIAGHDRGGDIFGAVTFTRVVGQSVEFHGEAAWREQGALLLGGKCTTASGITFIAEFYTPPNTAYFRGVTVSPLAGRLHYAFFDVGKNRLRERPGWKEWDLGAYLVANLDDRSYTAVFDANRRFGNHFSAYTHVEIPRGGSKTEYGATPYAASTSIGVRFQL